MTALGNLNILVKSETTRVIPMPNIIMASERGRNTLVSKVTSIR